MRLICGSGSRVHALDPPTIDKTTTDNRHFFTWSVFIPFCQIARNSDNIPNYANPATWRELVSIWTSWLKLSLHVRNARHARHPKIEQRLQAVTPQRSSRWAVPDQPAPSPAQCASEIGEQSVINGQFSVVEDDRHHPLTRAQAHAWSNGHRTTDNWQTTNVTGCYKIEKISASPTMFCNSANAVFPSTYVAPITELRPRKPWMCNMYMVVCVRTRSSPVDPTAGRRDCGGRINRLRTLPPDFQHVKTQRWYSDRRPERAQQNSPGHRPGNTSHCALMRAL